MASLIFEGARAWDPSAARRYLLLQVGKMDDWYLGSVGGVRVMELGYGWLGLGRFRVRAGLGVGVWHFLPVVAWPHRVAYSPDFWQYSGRNRRSVPSVGHDLRWLWLTASWKVAKGHVGMERNSWRTLEIKHENIFFPPWNVTQFQQAQQKRGRDVISAVPPRRFRHHPTQFFFSHFAAWETVNSSKSEFRVTLFFSPLTESGSPACLK